MLELKTLIRWVTRKYNKSNLLNCQIKTELENGLKFKPEEEIKLGNPSWKSRDDASYENLRNSLELNYSIYKLYIIYISLGHCNAMENWSCHTENLGFYQIDYQVPFIDGNVALSTDVFFENMSTINERKCCLPCYIWHLWRQMFIIGPLLPPIVLDNLFGFYKQGRLFDGKGGWGYTIKIET